MTDSEKAFEESTRTPNIYDELRMPKPTDDAPRYKVTDYSVQGKTVIFTVKITRREYEEITGLPMSEKPL